MLYIVYITPDGNCYFRALSQFLFQTESKYNLLRMTIYTYAKQNIDFISNFQDSVEISPNKFISTRHYIYNMGNNKEWSGDIEIILSTHIFNINIEYIKITKTKK